MVIKMFDRIVLGFLMEKSMTGYEIKKNMEQSTSFFFNTSFGNIYPTLKKLEEGGHVTGSEEVINGKLNKSYTITESGRYLFMEWLENHSEIGMIRDEALCRIFFFSHLDRDKKEKELVSYIARLSKQIEVLKSIKARHINKVDEWKIKSLDFGIDYYAHVKKSYQKILKEL